MSSVHSQSSSDVLIVISANIEGSAANRASVLSELYRDKHSTVYVSIKPTKPNIEYGQVFLVWH